MKWFKLSLGPYSCMPILVENVLKYVAARMVLPVMNVAFIVPNRNGYISDLTKIKMWVIQVVVRSDPPYPHSTGLLSGKHPD